jgi:hypothetical protein
MVGRGTRRISASGVAAVLVASLFVTHRASAFPTSRLTYVRNKGTKQCPTEEIVRREVATRLGYDPFFVWAERTIVAQIWRESTGYRATVQLLDRQNVVRGSRSLRSSSDDCGELIQAAALAISISIDPESVSRPPGTPPHDAPPPSSTGESPRSSGDDAARGTRSESNAAPPSRAATRTSALAATPGDGPPRKAVAPKDDTTAANFLPPNEVDRARVESPPSEPLRIAPMIGATLWSAVNLAPAVSFGGTAFVGAEWRALGLFGELRKSLPASGQGIAADLLVGAILPCVRYTFLFGCADLDFGELRFEGAQSKTARYVAGGGRIGARIEAKPLLLRAHLDVLAPLDRTVVLMNGSEVWQLPAMSVALGFGASLPF